jgi:hypothetical protein
MQELADARLAAERDEEPAEPGGLLIGKVDPARVLPAPPLGVDIWRANRLAVASEALSGEVEGDIVDAAGKAAALLEWAEAYGVPLRRTIAIGDGANDLDMLAAAGLGIGYRSKPLLREHLANHILYGDLTAALYAQGYRVEEIRQLN